MKNELKQDPVSVGLPKLGQAYSKLSFLCSYLFGQVRIEQSGRKGTEEIHTNSASLNIFFFFPLKIHQGRKFLNVMAMCWALILPGFMLIRFSLQQSPS